MQLIKVDFTNYRSSIAERADLARADRKNLPVNLIYPPDYPARPAVMLGEIVSPGDVLYVLDYLTKGEAEKTAATSSP